jgi:hypothetical protein
MLLILSGLKKQPNSCTGHVFRFNYSWVIIVTRVNDSDSCERHQSDDRDVAFQNNRSHLFYGEERYNPPEYRRGKIDRHYRT